MSRKFKVKDYILVEIDTAIKSYYVGLITKGQRKKLKSLVFFFKQVPETIPSKRSDTVVILPEVGTGGATRRQNLLLEYYI